MLATRKIKVLECIRQGQVGGGESHLLSLVENLDRSRFEPIVLSFTEGPMVDKLRAQNIDCHVIYTEKPFDISKWKIVRQFIKEKGVDIIHAHGTRANSNVLWSARSLKIPVVYTVHGWSFHQDQNPIVRNLRILGEKYLTTKSDVNISVSASNKESGKVYLKNFQSEVINNGIDQNKFFPDKPHKNIRQELNIPESDVLILFVARFTAQKQPLLLLKAFQEVLKTQTGIHLLMVGDGELRAEAEALVKNSDSANKITLQPFRADIPDILAAGNIFVLPSLWEGLPIGLLEAMAMGKAIIATDVDGTNEVIENNSNGLLIESGNIEALRKALIRLAGDEQLRTTLQQNAKNTVKQKYNAGSMTRQIEDVYLKLFSDQKAPHGV